MDISLHKTCMNMVYGVILNTKGEALHNVTIKLIDQKLNPIMHTITSKDGSFILLPPACCFHQLIIAKPGYTTLLIKTIILNQPMYITLRKIPRASCDVIGKCFYPDGTLAEHVIVLLDKETTNRKTISDKHGCFAFFQLASGLHQLEFLGETCETYKAYFQLYDYDTFIDLDGICLEKKNIGCTIHGIIKDQHGTTLPNILVLLYCALCEQFVTKTYTNKDGIYFFGNLKQGSYFIKAIY